MIGRLKGVIDSHGEDFVILDVHGVGYIVHCSARTLHGLPPKGEAAALAIETQVREDSIKLFGFSSDAERDWFRLLQSVQGVGAKVALAVQSILGPAELATAIACQDRGAFARAPGVGPRLAARITAELKDKAPVFGGVDASFAASQGADAPEGANPAVTDAISALVNLGYGRSQAALAVAASISALGPDAPASALIKRGLKELAQ
ncbi:MAG: Holliday junction branch migration protein RuvA [Methylocella sp.]